MYQQKSSMLSQEQISQKLQLYMSARNLASLDPLKAPNTYLILYLSQPQKKKKMILKTRIHQNDSNPNYVQTAVVDFIFQVKQKLTFQIHYESKLSKLVGRLETSVGQIFGSPINGLIKPIKNDLGEQTGKIIIRCQKIEKGKRKTFSGQVTAKGLPNLKWWYFFGGTCPFFRIFRKRKDDELLLYQSQVINYSTDPKWKPFKLLEQKLCKLNQEMKLQIRVYNYSSNGNHTLIGTSIFCLAQLQKIKNFPILFNKKQQKGQIIFKNVNRTVKHEFGQYIQNGLQLALTTCIDFTASNGNPQSKDSLHYSGGSRKSHYEEAMSQVLNILLDYDYDKLVPCYGFGAQVNHPKFNTKGRVSHCFPLNGNQDNPNIYQKEQIIKAYRGIFRYLKFSGPTYFSSLLKTAMSECKNFQQNPDKTEYMILFILTDGQIHDKQQVIDLLVKCGRLPLSIIIVGLGKSDFAIMQDLDDDDALMTDSQGRKTERDLVQFVQFQKFKNDGVQLAKQILYQLPRQVQQYFQLVGIHPQDMKRRKSDIQEQMWLKNSLA